MPIHPRPLSRFSGTFVLIRDIVRALTTVPFLRAPDEPLDNHRAYHSSG